MEEAEKSTFGGDESKLESAVDMERLSPVAEAASAKKETKTEEVESCDEDEVKEAVDEKSELEDKLTGRDGQEGRECVAEAGVLTDSEDKGVDDERNERVQQHQHETKNAQEGLNDEANESIEVHTNMSDAGAHATNSLTNSMAEDTNCREVEDGAESKEQVAKADAKTPLSESESCVDEEAKESVVEMKVTRADAKLMAELDSGAERKTGESETAAYLKTRIANLKACEAFVNCIKGAKFLRLLQTGIATVVTVNSFEAAASRVTSTATSDSNLSCRLWIERMVAGLNHILEITTKPELVQALDPIRKTSLELQRYSAAQFPDYLQDMQNDVKFVEYLQQIGTLDSSGLAKPVRFLLDQLRQDCAAYSSKQAPRTEEQWRQLTMTCDRLTTWIKQVSLLDDQFPSDFLTETIQMLGAFDAHFPKRIPVGLLENMISMAQNANVKHTSSGIVGNALLISASSDINDCGGYDETHRESALTNGNPEAKNETAPDLVNCKENEGVQIQPRPTAADNAFEKELESYIKLVRRLSARSINDFQLSIKAGNCTPEGATKFRNIFLRMVDVVTTHYPKDCRRLWLEHMVAACTAILQGVENPVVVQIFEPLKLSCSQLNQYISSRYSDYLHDMLTDVKLIDEMSKASNPDLRKLAPLLRRLMNQLRCDCMEYFNKRKRNVGETRSEEKWGHLTKICEKLAAWINLTSQMEDRLRDEHLQRLIRTLSEFSKQFPNRIPPQLLVLHNRNTNVTSAIREKPRAESGDNPKPVDDSSRNKRPRYDSNSVGPEPKRPAHHGALDQVNFVAKQYMNAAFKARRMIVHGGSSVREAESAKALSDMKAMATSSNHALYELLRRDGVPTNNTAECFRFATQMMANTITGVPGDAVEYDWLVTTVVVLRQVFLLGSSTVFKKTLSESISKLDTHLHIGRRVRTSS